MRSRDVPFLTAQLPGADLGCADVTGVDLSGADLSYTVLTGAILRDVRWSNTKCPDGTISNAATDRTCLAHLTP